MFSQALILLSYYIQLQLEDIPSLFNSVKNSVRFYIKYDPTYRLVKSVLLYAMKYMWPSPTSVKEAGQIRLH